MHTKNLMPRSTGHLDVTFIPLYDHTGTTQLICLEQEWKDLLLSLKTESVIKATGVVVERPKKDHNKVCCLLIYIVHFVLHPSLIKKYYELGYIECQ